MVQSTMIVQLATSDQPALAKPARMQLPITRQSLLEAARRKYRNVSKHSRVYDGVSGEELVDDEAALRPTLVVLSGRAGWGGAECLQHRKATSAAVGNEAGEAAPDAPPIPTYCTPELQLQLVSFSYDRGQPPGVAATVNARHLRNPGPSAKGRTGLDRRLATEVLATSGAGELCARVVQESLRALAQAAAGRSPSGGDAAPTLVRVGVGCDRGLHRSVAIVEAANGMIARGCDHTGVNGPWTLLPPAHRELATGARRPGRVAVGAGRAGRSRAGRKCAKTWEHVQQE